MLRQDAAEPPVSMAEAQAYVRIESGEEEAVVASLLRSATATCEQFLGQALVERGFEETIPASVEWRRLSVTPVRAITRVEALDGLGGASALASGAYAIDIDSAGDGWVRLSGTIGGGVVRVTGTAGLAADGNGVPEPIRQGILRLTAFLFNVRDGAGGEPPAAVTALWRPYRRMRLA